MGGRDLCADSCPALWDDWITESDDIDSLFQHRFSDAGREGELIFRYIASYAKTTKPIERLWLQSMTPASIREGFAQLRSNNDMLPLAEHRTRVWHGHDGAFFPETLYFWGTHLPSNYGWDRKGKATAAAVAELADDFAGDLGAVDVVTKPFDPETLCDHLKDIWSRLEESA